MTAVIRHNNKRGNTKKPLVSLKYIDAVLKPKSWQNPTISACLVILVNIIVQLLKDEGNSLQRQIPPHPDYFQYTTQSRDSKEITNPASGENREKTLCENIRGHCTIDDLGKKKTVQAIHWDMYLC